MQVDLPRFQGPQPQRYVYRRSLRSYRRLLNLLLALALMGAAYRMVFPPLAALQQRNVINYFGALPSPSGAAPAETPAFRHWHAAQAESPGNPTSLRLFPAGIPPHPFVEELRTQGFPAELVGEQGRADVVLREERTAGLPVVSPLGQLELPVPHRPEVRRRLFAEHLQPPAPGARFGLFASPGLSREYDKVAMIAQIAVRAGRASEASPLFPLVTEIPVVRLVPELCYLDAGDRQGFDFQILGNDELWYSLSERKDVHFHVVTGTPAVVPHAVVPYVFCSPAETDRRYDGQRVIIEATLTSAEIRPLTARALIVVRVPPQGGR